MVSICIEIISPLRNLSLWQAARDRSTSENSLTSESENYLKRSVENICSTGRDKKPFPRRQRSYIISSTYQLTISPQPLGGNRSVMATVRLRSIPCLSEVILRKHNRTFYTGDFASIRKLAKNYAFKANPRRLIDLFSAFFFFTHTVLPECIDHFSDCPHFKQYCQRASFFFVMKSYCPMTCGHCSTDDVKL